MTKSDDYEPIDGPSHYVAGREYEPASVILDWGLDYFLGSVLKYVSRAGRKGNKLRDLRKAEWFLMRAIREEEKNELSKDWPMDRSTSDEHDPK